MVGQRPSAQRPHVDAPRWNATIRAADLIASAKLWARTRTRIAAHRLMAPARQIVDTQRAYALRGPAGGISFQPRRGDDLLSSSRMAIFVGRRDASHDRYVPLGGTSSKQHARIGVIPTPAANATIEVSVRQPVKTPWNLCNRPVPGRS